MSQFGSDQHKVERGSRSAGEVIYTYKEDIINRWLYRVTKELEAARSEAKPILVNTLPSFLVNLAQALSPKDPRQLATDSSSIAQEHGGERARLSNFAPEDIIREYQILRDTVHTVLKTKYHPTEEDISILNRSVDKAMTEAMNSYFLILNRLRERMSIFIGHEIRKPLDSIHGKALLIKRNPDKTDWIQSLTGTILSEVEKIHVMIHELTEPLAFQNNPKFRVELQEGELLSAIKEAVAGLTMRYGDKFKLKGEPLTGYWNLAYIKKGLESLCTNLLNYHKKEMITITLEKVHGRALISVHNEHKFVPADKQEFLFQAFRRDQNEKSHFRTWGIGLPIARGVAEAHGGSVGVDSSPEHGTTFLMEFLIDSRPYQPTALSPGSELPAESLPESKIG